ncbi:nibrin-like [Phlebotomus argentipes]|uniref:nibrin-like n=1 Tax=Phlebotomus argentipes TaxID=94469 RepID=UPI002892A142|nr:nibrin-like [Phlebotomus argentipes]
MKSEISFCEAVELKAGDTVQFGRFHNSWTVESTSLSIVTSSLSASEVEKVAEDVRIVSGRLLESWSSDCTHLVMAHIVITMKVLLALVSEVPIVRPDFVTALVLSAQTPAKPPNPEDFMPDIQEENLNKATCSFHPDSERRTVFSGKRFIFLSQEVMKRYETVVRLAGGRAVSIETDKLSHNACIQVGTVVVSSSSTAPGARKWPKVQRIEKTLQANGHRFIPDKEIALAIIYKCTEKFCNPLYNFAANFLFCRPAERPKAEILAEETPAIEDCKDSPRPPKVTLPETLLDHASVILNEIPQALEIPETLPEPQVEPPKAEKRKRSAWTRVEKDAGPSKRTRSAAVAPERRRPESPSREKRKLKDLLNNSPEEEFSIVVKRARKKAPEAVIPKSQPVRSSARNKGQESAAVSLPKPPTFAEPVKISRCEMKSTGWLSKKFSEASLEESEKEAEKSGDWTDSLKACVQTKLMDSSLADESSSDSLSRKSFKAFKRKSSFVAQKIVEQLVQVDSGRGE